MGRVSCPWSKQLSVALRGTTPQCVHSVFSSHLFIVSVHLVWNMSFVTYSKKNIILLTVLHSLIHLWSLTKAETCQFFLVEQTEKETYHAHSWTSLDKSYNTPLKEDEKNKYSGQEMVVFHNWLWESCLVFLTVLSLPELNKEHLEPVSDGISSSAFCHTLTCVLSR